MNVRAKVTLKRVRVTTVAVGIHIITYLSVCL